MKYFFDTEFIEDGRTIDLISIGIVSEDGRTYYAENYEADLSRANKWVQENVLVHLNVRSIGKIRRQIREDILFFIGKDQSPEFWADYASYDWVALCQLFGTMMDLPHGWPMFCMDIQQLRKSKGNPELPAWDGQEHLAIDDARQVKQRWEFLTKL